MSEINIQPQIPQISIDTNVSTYHLPIASSTVLGGVKIGRNLTIEEDGTLNATSTEYELPVASYSDLGGVIVGNGLTVTNGTISVDVDSSLSANSTNPVQNNIVASNFATVTSSISTLDNQYTTLNQNLGTLSSTVSSDHTTLTDLSTTVGNQATSIETNTENINNNSSAIESINTTLSSLNGRVTDVEGDITDIQSDITDLNVLLDSSLDNITYSYLLPVSTWTSGNIFVVKRGKVGFIYFDLEGSLTLSAGASSVIYTFADLIPAVKSSSVLLTDDGAILGELDDYTYELSLVNIDAQHSKTITKVKGSIPLTFV